jgi:anti-anti-sigma regulatory factor
MDITFEKVEQNPKLTIMALNGDLDGSNYLQAIEAAKTVQAGGSTYLLLDMTHVPFMGSAGLVALHTIALLMQNKPLPDEEDGWAAFRNLANDIDAGMQPFVKILNPQASVERGLKKTGMNQFIEVLTERDAALDAFKE